MVCAALAAAQARDGHDVAIVCEARGSAPDGVGELLKSIRGADQVQIERVPRQRLFGALYGDFREVATALSVRPDLVHIHGVWNPIALAASRAARRMHVPYVLSTHGALHPSCMHDRSGRKRAALTLGWRRMLAEARRVLCLNDEEAAQSDRIARVAVSTVLPNGVDLAAFGPVVPGAFRRTLGRDYFVFVGRLDEVKGLGDLFDAFIEYRRRGGAASLVLVGPDWGERPGLERRAAEAQLASEVVFTGPLYDRRKLEVLTDAIAFVHRPRYEGFGLAVVEAMACAAPAILGERCLLPTRGEADGVVLAGGATAAFADAMQRLDGDRGLRDRLGAAGRACVERCFDWTIIARRTLDVAGLGAT